MGEVRKLSLLAFLRVAKICFQDVEVRDRIFIALCLRLGCLSLR